MTIYKTESGYVISSNQIWRPGCYDSEETARLAFTFDDDVLLAMQDRINNIKGEDRLITMDDLRAES